MQMRRSVLLIVAVLSTACLVAGCRDTESETEDVSVEVERLSGELNAAQAKLAEVTGDNVQLRKNIDELFEELEAAESKLATGLQSAERARKEAVDSIKRQVGDEVQRGLAEANAGRTEAATQVEALQAEVERLRTDVKERDTLIAELEAWIAEVQSQGVESEMIIDEVDSDPNTVFEEV